MFVRALREMCEKGVVIVRASWRGGGGRMAEKGGKGEKKGGKRKREKMNGIRRVLETPPNTPQDADL